MPTNKRVQFIVVALLWSAFLFAAGWSLRDVMSPAAASPPSATVSSNPLLDEVWGRVRESFVGDVPSDTLRNYGAIHGALATLNDRWTVFVEPEPRARERDQLSGQFGGIGVNLRQNDAGKIVLSPQPDSPAQQAGIRPGDILIGVDGIMLPEKPDFNDVSRRVRGDAGSSVRVTVLRDGKQMEFTISRGVIRVSSVESHLITNTTITSPAIGYIAIHAFTERTGSEVKQAVAELRKKGSQAYLIDLRDNGGGLLPSAVDVASIFLDSGAVLIERRRNQPDVSFPVTKDETTGVYREPIAVLINGNTASASEIVAGAIQDDKRGMLIGEKSFGKGLVQSIYDLSDGSSVHITSAKWLTPHQHTIDGVGLTPDIPVKRAEGEIEAGRDSQMDRALSELRRDLAHR